MSAELEAVDSSGEPVDMSDYLVVFEHRRGHLLPALTILTGERLAQRADNWAARCADDLTWSDEGERWAEYLARDSDHSWWDSLGGVATRTFAAADDARVVVNALRFRGTADDDERFHAAANAIAAAHPDFPGLWRWDADDLASAVQVMADDHGLQFDIDGERVTLCKFFGFCGCGAPENPTLGQCGNCGGIDDAPHVMTWRELDRGRDLDAQLTDLVAELDLPTAIAEARAAAMRAGHEVLREAIEDAEQYPDDEDYHCDRMNAHPRWSVYVFWPGSDFSDAETVVAWVADPDDLDRIEHNGNGWTITPADLEASA